MLKRIYCLYLDILSIPSIFMSRKGDAEYHLRYLCPMCPKFRRKMRDTGGGDCWWYLNWKKKNFDIPRHFGVKNWITQILFMKTNLSRFKR